ncbi:MULTISPECIES: N-acetylglucosamine kinase [unclassified Streptomyces]|uniref:N-acetylglucosamine kinase n=1 Tax=unclassified Streptomyces TaxID=2593676 RepID=UPI00382E37DC
MAPAVTPGAAPPPDPGTASVLAVDSGGSGLRVMLADVEGRWSGTRVSAVPVRTGTRGIDPGHLMEQLVPMVRSLAEQAAAERGGTPPTGSPPGPGVAVVGAAGLATLGDALRTELPEALARAFGVRTTVLAADAVTAYVGALGIGPGAVVAAGTGVIALGTDLTAWRRADGWGHLLGDCGGGAWIGRAGLEAALRAHDGRPDGSTALLTRAEARFGPLPGLPGLLYPRADRPAVLASFAPDVAACAPSDPLAARILRTAARHLADSAAAVCPPDGTPRIAVTGGLLRLGDALLVPLAEEFDRRLPSARRVTAEGDPLTGALRIGRALASGTLRLPPDEWLLHVTPPASDRKQGD